jgi:hypothetical protein
MVPRQALYHLTTPLEWTRTFLKVNVADKTETTFTGHWWLMPIILATQEGAQESGSLKPAQANSS